ncbi:hypothetical protein J7400_02760 [Shimia sp. R9_2]|nr:hypothetical protein [Shimia sp. R9_2]
MVHAFLGLLAADQTAQGFGSGLKPELREAMEASLRFPAAAASPMPITPVDPAGLPQNVVPIVSAVNDGRKQA